MWKILRLAKGGVHVQWFRHNKGVVVMGKPKAEVSGGFLFARMVLKQSRRLSLGEWRGREKA